MKLTEEDTREIIKQLDGRCWSCTNWTHERGTYVKNIPSMLADDGETCVRCNGTTWELTDAGADLIAFLQRHGATK